MDRANSGDQSGVESPEINKKPGFGTLLRLERDTEGLVKKGPRHVLLGLW